MEGWKFKKSLGNNHNVYARTFPGAKLKSMKDYVKPCIGENNPDYVILHVDTNELNSELTPERIAKSVIDVGKNIQTNYRTVSISCIVPHNDNFNKEAMEVNKEYSKMCKKEKFILLDQSNINPKIHLNRSKLHLNRNGYEKLGNTDIFMISETKLDESFPPAQFSLDGYSVLFRSDRNGNDVGILLFIRGGIPSKLLPTNNNIEGFEQIIILKT